MVIKHIQSLNEYIDTILGLDNLIGMNEDGKGRLVWWFRGHSNENYKLLAGIHRIDPQKERYYIHEFMQKVQTRSNYHFDENDYAKWLSVMQHHGLPTRLLDWSISPLVALFFAVESHNSSNNACVWALVPYLLNRTMRTSKFVYSIKSRIAKPFVGAAFRGYEIKSGILAVTPIENNQRIQVQQGAFTVHSENTPIEEIKNNEKWLVKIIVEKESIIQISRDLQFLGIKRSDLFPDVDNLAKDIQHSI